jgi:EmrB/QacA subfamily drug resistance transporter
MRGRESSPGPAEPAVGRREWLTLAVAALGVLIVMADSTIINVALPSIRQDLGYLEVSITQLQWVVNAYVLSFAVLMLAAGRLADMFGRRLIFVVGLAVFLVASIACGAAQDIGVLIAFRAVQGAGAALITPASLSIVTTTFPEEKRGVAIAIWSGIVGLGVGLGPLAGGLLTEHVDWRWVFYINVPIGLAAIVGAFLWVDESRGPVRERRLDVAGIVLSAAGLFALTFALLKGNEFGWGDPRTLLLFVAAGATLTAFVIVERAQRAPLLDLSLFRSRTFSGANVTAVFVGFALFGLLFFGTLFTQNVMRYSAVESGAAFLPMMLLIMALAPVVGKLTDRMGPRWLLTAGMGLLAVALLSFGRLDVDSSFWDLLPGLLVGGVAFALVLTPLTTAALAGVPLRNAGIAAAVINSTRQVGGLLGLAIMGAVSEIVVDRSLEEGQAGVEAFVDSFQVIVVVAAAVAFAGMVVAAATVTAAPASQPAGAAPAPEQLPVMKAKTWVVPAPSIIAELPEPPAAAALDGAEEVPGATRISLWQRPRVLIVAGPAAGSEIPVTSEPFVLGRAERGLGTLGADPELSRRHASISFLDRERLLIEDLSSTNGTYVNDYRVVAPTVVRAGDVVRLGTTTLQISERTLESSPADGSAASVGGVR